MIIIEAKCGKSFENTLFIGIIQCSYIALISLNHEFKSKTHPLVSFKLCSFCSFWERLPRRSVPSLRWPSRSCIPSVQSLSPNLEESKGSQCLQWLSRVILTALMGFICICFLRRMKGSGSFWSQWTITADVHQWNNQHPNVVGQRTMPTEGPRPPVNSIWWFFMM